jgi:hypothetical protein
MFLAGRVSRLVVASALRRGSATRCSVKLEQDAPLLGDCSTI